jgi:hypothetical protein
MALVTVLFAMVALLYGVNYCFISLGERCCIPVVTVLFAIMVALLCGSNYCFIRLECTAASL